MSNLTVVEYQDKRVLTTQQLAQAYQTEAKNIQMNFSNNTHRFAMGRDYYFLDGESLKEFKNSLPNDIGEPLKFAPSLILWTQRGANRHCKILDTDKAWQQFDVLEETYFNVKTGQYIAQPMTQLEILAQAAQALVEHDKQLKEIAAAQTAQAKEIQGIREVVALSPNDWRKDAAALINKAAQKLGGFEHLRDLRAESYKLLNERFGVSLKQRLTNKRRRMAEEGASKSRRDSLNYLDIIAEDKKLIEGYLIIVKELAIKSGV